MKVHFFLLLCCLFVSTVFSQKKLDTLKIKSLLTSAETLEGTNMDSAIFLERQALSIAKANKSQKWQAEGVLLFGLDFDECGQL